MFAALFFAAFAFSSLSLASLQQTCDMIGAWKPGEAGPSKDVLKDHMQVVGMDFLLKNLGQKQWLLVDARGDKERETGYFPEALSLRAGIKEGEADDYTKSAILQRLSSLGGKKRVWAEFQKLNLILFCNGEKCPKSARGACSLRNLGFRADQVHLVSSSFEELYSAGLSLVFGSSSQAGKSADKSIHVLRLRPGMDVRKSLSSYAKANNLKASSVVSAAGSLQGAVLRFANQKEATTLSGPFEVVSLGGTLSAGTQHLHMSISDGTGKTLGGHLSEGSLVFTTLEITLLEAKGLEFFREDDSSTGHKELVITPSSVLRFGD